MQLNGGIPAPISKNSCSKTLTTSRVIGIVRRFMAQFAVAADNQPDLALLVAQRQAQRLGLQAPPRAQVKPTQ
jgi:hypothetical protein